MTLEDKDARPYMEELKQLLNYSERDNRNRYLTMRVERLLRPRMEQSRYDKRLLQLYEEEWDHQEHVIRILRLKGIRKRHDWSKDPFYIFVLAGKFKFFVTDPSFEKIFSDEVKRHYGLEAHHEQFIDHEISAIQEVPSQNPMERGINLDTIKDNSLLDLVEMAADRLSRCIYKNKGVVSHDDMRRFTPKFKGPDQARLEEKYFQHVDNLSDLAVRVYLDIKKESAYERK